MGIHKFKGTVTLVKSLGNRVLLQCWREEHRHTRYDIQLIPYHLAMYLNLIPNTPTKIGFTRTLYDFDHKQFDVFTTSGTDELIKRVTKIKNKLVITLDLSKGF